MNNTLETGQLLPKPPTSFSDKEKRLYHKLLPICISSGLEADDIAILVTAWFEYKYYSTEDIKDKNDEYIKWVIDRTTSAYMMLNEYLWIMRLNIEEPNDIEAFDMFVYKSLYDRHGIN